MKPSRVEVVATHAVLIAVTVAVIYPVLWVVKIALTSGGGLSLDPSPFPSDPTLDNFARFLSRGEDSHGLPLFWLQLGNSLLVSAAATLIGVLFATSAAYAFSFYRFPGQRSGLKMLLVTQMFPAVVTAVPLFVIMHALGLFGTLAGLVLVYSTASVPFCVWMLKGYFDSIPRELYEAALLEGAKPRTIFWRIMLPLAKPGIAVTALFSFLTAWNEFILATIFLKHESLYTLPIVLQQAAGSDKQTDWGLFAAGSLIVSIPVVALFFVLQKNLVRGLTAGSVKG